MRSRWRGLSRVMWVVMGRLDDSDHTRCRSPAIGLGLNRHFMAARECLDCNIASGAVKVGDG